MGRVTAAILIILFLLSTSFAVIVASKQESIESGKMFAEGKLDVIEHIFNVNNITAHYDNGTEVEISGLQQAAYKEWLDQEKINWGEYNETDADSIARNPDPNDLIMKKLNGPLQAFCDNEKRKAGGSVSWIGNNKHKKLYNVKKGDDTLDEVPLC